MASYYNWNVGETAIARVIVGCFSTALTGGNCGKGALSAAFSWAASPLIIKFPSLGEWSAVPESVEAGLIGGEAAQLAGGKFEDGFTTAAVQYMVAPPPPPPAGSREGVLSQIGRDLKAIAVDIYAAVVGQLGMVFTFAYYDVPAVAKDLYHADFLKAGHDFFDLIFDLAFPHYGYYGGANWGFKHPWKDLPGLNQVDVASSLHDMRCDGHNCLSGQYQSDVSDRFYDTLPAGPFGFAYQLLGLVPLTISGALGH
jgi:hypothetical protein